MPLISICIPAYKNVEFLERLLNSISIQIFKDYEVIITDDSPDNSIEYLIKQYQAFKVFYYKNEIALGTPANWNLAISKANGEWIKLMHDDDWFADETSLQTFTNFALKYPQTHLIFSGFTEIKSNNQKKSYIINTAEKKLLQKSPFNLLKKNFIGHPSTTLIKNKRQEWYDETIKWVVDIEFYIRYLKDSNFIAIKKALINIGVHDKQVTKEVFRNPKIEIHENLYLLIKIGKTSLKNIFVYDYYWRLFRNLNMRDIQQVLLYSSNIQIPDEIKKMLHIQFQIPLPILRIGILSKFCMLATKIFT